MNEPTLSIIIPVYNAHERIKKCLESLIRQTYQQLEIICVDDGSTDCSLEVLQQYAAEDSRIKVIHQANAGVSSARNRGIEEATGKYLTFVDADDWVEHQTYELALTAFTEGVDLVSFGVIVDGGSNLGLENYCNLQPKGEIRPTPKYLAEMNASLWNKVYRASIINNYKVRFPDGVAYGEDETFFFCYTAVMAGNMYGIRHKLYHYVQYENSAMANPQIDKVLADNLLRTFNYLYSFFYRNGVTNIMYPVLSRKFGILFRYAQNQGNINVMLPQLTRAAKQSGLYDSCQEPYILKLKMLNLSPLHRFFHWYTGNRECYGVAGMSFLSITYESERRIYRLLGRLVRIINEN